LFKNSAVIDIFMKCLGVAGHTNPLALAIFLSAGFVLAKNSAPVLDVSGIYHGIVGENGGIVDVTPEIRAENGPICGYRIVNTHKGKIPFEVFMLDQEAGTAQLRARHPLNCEEKKNYVVTIAAVSCAGIVSESVEVHVTVKDVNEYIPEWSEEEYSGQIEEGELAESILKVSATDRDCSPTFGDICHYTISSPDQPFRVDEHGVITNTAPLSAQESRSHVLSVIATDCGGKESSPVLVTITVLPRCQTSWADVSTSMTYIPGTGPQPIFPAAHLTLCPSVCPTAHIETTLTLHTDHVGVGCDRDTYSLASQRKMCGASNQAVELLPAQSEETPWVNNLNADLGREAGPVYEFDGSNGVIIPETVLSHNLGSEFTISTWMKHEEHTNDKHLKEHLVCLADDHRKNRHHTSLFVRNCKLVLLLRRDYKEDERNVFKPAEWRWSIPQVCDNRWHHYAVSVSSQGAELTLDGELWQPENNNPEVIDDWPLHPAADLRTTLTVGACWHGSDLKMKHSLRGYLAGLSVLPGKREHSEVLKCLVQCSESLQLPATNLLEPGMEMVTNSHGSQVTIDGEDAENMNQLVRQVAYLNTREFPAPGRRRLELSTAITCIDGTTRIVPSAVSGILVLSVPQPTITISGTENISRVYEAFKRGVRIFSDLRISVSKGSDEAEPVSGVNMEKVDKCTINVFPPLNPDHEEIKLPDMMLKSLKLGNSVTGNGVEISGADMIYNYEQVIRQVTYTNKKPAYYLNRQFKIVCSELNQRFTSNEYVQTLTVIHPPVSPENMPPVQPAHHQLSQHGAELPGAQVSSSSQEFLSLGQTQGHAVIVVVVVCMGLLFTVLTLGVIRLRAAHKRALREEAEVEMAWDDAALNITVNPLEETTECRAMGGEKAIESDMDQDSSDDEMYVEETSDDDDEEDEAPTRHRLEWDDGL